MTSPAYVGDLQEIFYESTVCPPSFVVIASIFSEVRRWGLYPPGPRRPKEAQSE